jgi:CheY-like chemotaxis protein
MHSVKLTDYTDDAPRSERRAPAPITNLPVNAITHDSDPTLEIRTLIEQLQQAARDARTKQRDVEMEREDLTSQLAEALMQIDHLRSTERDLRSHFTEISATLRERDHAVEAAERSARAATRAQEELSAIVKQRDEIQRQRDEAGRQRDETQHRLDGMTRAYSETGMRSTEVQKQLAAIRQARDSAHSQIFELTNRAARLEDEIAELGYQRDAALKAQKQAETETEEYRWQLDSAISHRDAAAKQIEDLTAELDEQRKKFLDLAEQKAAVLEADHEHAAALGAAREQLNSISQERDLARQHAQTQEQELEKLRQQFQAYREQDARNASAELVSAHERATAFEAQARQSRHDAVNFEQQLLALNEKVSTFEVLADDATAHQKETEMQLLALKQQCDADRMALQHARQQAEEMTRERNAMREIAEDTRQELEAQLMALRAQSASHVESRPMSDADLDSRELHRRLERQRLQTIDLAAQLESAQQIIRETSANLAEARLQLRFAGGSSNPASAPQLHARQTARPVRLQLGELLPALQQSFEIFSHDPAAPGRLFDLHESVVAYAERTRVMNCVALHRLAHAFAGLLGSLAASPDQVNASTLHTIEQTIEFFDSVSNEPSPERFKDPARARIYVVDDDADNCHCVQLVMQEQMIQTSGAQDPSTALLELASEAVDLIFLDINMPHMDGFELCQRLRALSLHAKTPVVFLTGLATAEKRAQSILSGGNEFLAKPFNLHELTVKALTLILQAQTEMA